LRKLNDEERIIFLKTGISPTAITSYKDISGNAVANRNTLDPTETAYNYYVNDKNEIIECIIRQSTKEDKMLRRRIIDTLEAKIWGTITPAKPACDNQAATLKDILEKDQKNGRASGQTIDRKIDKENLEQVLGIIQNCGFPRLATVGKDGMSAIFYVIQHGTRKIMEQYLPAIKQSALNGELDLQHVAAMEDRVLLSGGEKQKYGTQFLFGDKPGIYKLEPLEDPKNVNERRKAMGLEPLEDFLRKWKIENPWSTTNHP
jgi:hypothetical protein